MLAVARRSRAVMGVDNVCLQKKHMPQLARGYQPWWWVPGGSGVQEARVVGLYYVCSKTSKIYLVNCLKDKCSGIQCFSVLNHLKLIVNLPICILFLGFVYSLPLLFGSELFQAFIKMAALTKSHPVSLT